MSEEMTDKLMEDAKLEYDRKALRDEEMCEPSIDNMREAIKQFWIGAKTEPPVAAIHVQQDWLAAFDAMAEKAGLFDKQEKLVNKHEKIVLSRSSFELMEVCPEISYGVQLGENGVNGGKSAKNLAEALKAVPDA